MLRTQLSPPPPPICGALKDKDVEISEGVDNGAHFIRSFSERNPIQVVNKIHVVHLVHLVDAYRIFGTSVEYSPSTLSEITPRNKPVYSPEDGKSGRSPEVSFMPHSLIVSRWEIAW